MPRDSHRSMYDGDDRVRLPVHIVILMVAVMVLVVGGGASSAAAALRSCLQERPDRTTAL